MTRSVLMVSHGHPDLSKGGAEVAAYNLFQALRGIQGWDAHFLARHGMASLERAGTPFVNHNGGHETLFAGETDSFYFSVRNPRRIMPAFRDFLRRVRPEVVHFHHYWQVGLELFAEIRRYADNVPVVLTLHEFLGICYQNGQMVKTSGELCRKSSPVECHACIPGRAPREYFLRKRYIQSFFHFVDHFVSPSAFLRDRYVEWGIPAERISVIENGLPANGPTPERASRARGKKDKVRFGFFGQMNPFKGVDVLLQAAEHLPKTLENKVQIEIHGGGLEAQSPDFQAHFAKLLAEAPKCVRYYGPYSQDDLPYLMGSVDWIVVPSIWWENSPVVIQEALKFRRPVICADIGGMAEKVRDNETGLHFRARNAADLAHRIEQVVEDVSLWPRLQANIQPPPSRDACAARHIQLYESLMNRQAQVLSATGT